MDGFHLANATLDRLGLRERKGAIETFDGWGFVALLERVRREVGDTVYAPAFERDVDEPVAGAIAIAPAVEVVVVEGNYLLSGVEPWVRVRGLLDEAWFCDTADDERVSRLVRRHVEFGRSPEAALAWATEVDGANARVIAPSRARADLVVSGVTWQPIEQPVVEDKAVSRARLRGPAARPAAARRTSCRRTRAPVPAPLPPRRRRGSPPRSRARGIPRR